MGTEQPEIDTSVAHPARMYDYLLGGKDNFPPDRELGDAILRHVPTAREFARANRAFMGRAVRHLASELGIRQFLDVGSGIPTAPNVHQIAQGIDPSSRVLYVDRDPLVLAHARALLGSAPQGRTAFVLGDFRQPESILDSAEMASTLDRDAPVALLLISLLMYFDADEGADPYPIVRRLVDALPSGSHVVISHPASDFDSEQARAGALAGRQAGVTLLPRARDEVAAFTDGLELVEPGLVPLLSWRPDAPVEDPGAVWYWSVVARKP